MKRPLLLLLLVWLLALLLPKAALASFTNHFAAWPSSTAEMATSPLPENGWPEASISLDLRELRLESRNGLFCNDDPVGNFDPIGLDPTLDLDDPARIANGVPEVHYWDWSHWWGPVFGGGITDWWQSPSADEQARLFRSTGSGWRLASGAESLGTWNQQFAATAQTESVNDLRQANAMAVVADGPVALASGVGLAGAASDAALYGYVAAENSAWVKGGLLALGAYHLYNFATDADYRGATMSIDGGTGFSSVGYAASDLFSASRGLFAQFTGATGNAADTAGGATLRLPATMTDELPAYQQAADQGFLVKTQSSSLPASNARAIWEAANGPVADGFDVDHIIQRQFGGTDELSNLQLKLSGLNRSEGSQAMWLNKPFSYGTVFDGVELAPPR